MIKRFLCVAGLMLATISGQAQASHIFAMNGSINGTPLAAGNSFTDPTIVTTVGALNTLHFDLFGSPDTFNVSFSDAGGSTVATPLNDSVFYNGSGTFATPVSYNYVFAFGSAGVFNGIVIPDFPVSFPDYLMPGGSQFSEPRIPFHIQVNNGTAVPEPSSMLLFGIGLVGMAFARSRRSKLTPTA